MAKEVKKIISEREVAGKYFDYKYITVDVFSGSRFFPDSSKKDAKTAKDPNKKHNS